MKNKKTKDVRKCSKQKKITELRPEWNGLSGERAFHAELTSCKGPEAVMCSTCSIKNRKAVCLGESGRLKVI